MELPERQRLDAAPDAMVVDLLIPKRVLRDSEEGYRALFENASDLIQSVKSDGSFIYVNPAWLKTLGYAENDLATLSMDLATLSMFDVIHPDDREHCLEIFSRVNADEYVADIEAKFVTKSGDIVLVEGSASSQREDGIPIATRAIFHNVTIARKAEEALKLARDMAETPTFQRAPSCTNRLTPNVSSRW